MVKPTIHGPDQAIQGDFVRLSCIIPGQESVGIMWQAEVSTSEAIEADVINEDKVEESNEAEIELRIKADSGIRKIRIQCIAQIGNLGQVTSDTHEIDVHSQQTKIPQYDIDIEWQHETTTNNKHNITQSKTEYRLRNRSNSFPFIGKEEINAISRQDEKTYPKEITRSGKYLEKVFLKTKDRSSPNSLIESFAALATSSSNPLIPPFFIISLVITHVAIGRGRCII